MVERRNFTGERFGRLVGKSPAGKVGKVVYWNFTCDCGTVSRKAVHHVVAGRSLSCGCFRRQASAAKATTHGYARTPTYLAWCGAKGRCENPSNQRFAYYGGRGIEFCKRWSESFEAFLEDMGERPPGMTLDREDNNRGYEPGNCRWATPIQQMGNRRGCYSIQLDGESVSLSEYARRKGLDGTKLQHLVATGRANLGVDVVKLSG